jgi:hypothetical protein
MNIKDVSLCMDEMYCIIFIRTGLDVNNIHSKFLMLYILMYLVLNLMHVLDFLDTSGMSVTDIIMCGNVYMFLFLFSINSDH